MLCIVICNHARLEDSDEHYSSLHRRLPPLDGVSCIERKSIGVQQTLLLVYVRLARIASAMQCS